MYAHSKTNVSDRTFTTPQARFASPQPKRYWCRRIVLQDVLCVVRERSRRWWGVNRQEVSNQSREKATYAVVSESSFFRNLAKQAKMDLSRNDNDTGNMAACCPSRRCRPPSPLHRRLDSGIEAFDGRQFEALALSSSEPRRSAGTEDKIT